MFIHDMKAATKTPKKQGGISLRPELWERIDNAARVAGVPRNQVMETILAREFGLATDFHKAHVANHKSEAGVGDGIADLIEDREQ